MLGRFLRRVYDGFDTSNEIDTDMWREVLRIINEGTVEGLSQAKIPPTHDRMFYRELRHSNEVFSAFKVHTMGVEMAAKLVDGDGNLKPFSKWAKDVASITSHQVGSWLRTEYDTAVIRAHAAADWREFERNKDVMPNLRWMPTTSPEPDSAHRRYWEAKLTLPVDDPFWNAHHPGDRWNCKCSLEATDEPVNRPADLEPAPPQRGLENNPGKDGHVFSDSHPYFPKDCSHCFAYRKSGLKNRLKALFVNKAKDCFDCPYIDGCNKIQEYKRLLKDPEYRNVRYDPKTGGLKATHVGHSVIDGKGSSTFFGNMKPADLESECQNLLYKWGHTAILRDEFVNSKLPHTPPSLDLELDGVIMDIRSITTNGRYGNALVAKNRQLGNVKRKTGLVSDSVCLHFHDASMFSEEKLTNDADWYKKFIVENGSKQRIKHIYVVVNGADKLKIYDI